MSIKRLLMKQVPIGTAPLGKPVKTGTYTGDGNPTKGINGLGFQPKYLFIYPQLSGNVSSSWAQKTDKDGLSTSMLLSDPGVGGNVQHYYEIDHVISLDADGFTVGDGTGSVRGNLLNINLVVYTYVAMASPSANFTIGTYNGDGNATQGVIGVGFQPKFLLISAVHDNAISTSTVAAKTDQDGVNAYMNRAVNIFLYTSDTIISLDANGFTVGDSTPLGVNMLNRAAITYSYMAWS